jgi:AraC-like DNA-binding protein
MPLPDIPLAAHRAFHATTVGELLSLIESHLGAACMYAPTERSISALANRYRLSAGELWFCSYGDPVKIHFRETNYIRVQFQHAGAGSTTLGARTLPIAPGQGCISSADAALSFGRGFQQLVWRVDRDALHRKLASMTGAPAAAPVEFLPALDMSSPGARALRNILHSIVHCISASARPNAFLLAELEQALMVSLLTYCQHSYSRLLRSDPPDAAPWQVRMLEEHIDANLDKPFDVDQAATLIGCSARSIYRAFREHRGCSPAQFSKQRRLLKALALLRDAPPHVSVMDIAYECGFGDLSHFSRDFARTFGESPSSIRRLGKKRR